MLERHEVALGEKENSTADSILFHGLQELQHCRSVAADIVTVNEFDDVCWNRHPARLPAIGQGPHVAGRALHGKRCTSNAALWQGDGEFAVGAECDEPAIVMDFLVVDFAQRQEIAYSHAVRIVAPTS